MKQKMRQKTRARSIRGRNSGNRATRPIGEDLFPARFCLMNITEHIRKYAAKQNVSEDKAHAKGMGEKTKEFLKIGAEIYAKA